MLSHVGEPLDALRVAIFQATRGQIRNLSIASTGDDSVVVRGDSQNYHILQLAIQATQQFGADHPTIRETRLVIEVNNGSPSEVVVLNDATSEHCQEANG